MSQTLIVFQVCLLLIFWSVYLPRWDKVKLSQKHSGSKQNPTIQQKQRFKFNVQLKPLPGTGIKVYSPVWTRVGLKEALTVSGSDPHAVKSW